jgi:cytochrome c oxidase subunit IV
VRVWVTQAALRLPSYSSVSSLDALFVVVFLRSIMWKRIALHFALHFAPQIALHFAFLFEQRHLKNG